jgi:DNA-binding LytR/AlgR family response regulator
MNTLDAVRCGSGEELCRSGFSSEPDGSRGDRHGYARGAYERDPEIRAYYRGRHQRVSLTDVVYLRADQKYVSVCHLDGVLLVDGSLRTFERDFPDLLLRIHRNALVARARLLGLERQPDGSTCALLIDCNDTPVVSRRHLGEVRRWLRETRSPVDPAQ